MRSLITYLVSIVSLVMTTRHAALGQTRRSCEVHLTTPDTVRTERGALVYVDVPTTAPLGGGTFFSGAHTVEAREDGVLIGRGPIPTFFHGGALLAPQRPAQIVTHPAEGRFAYPRAFPLSDGRVGLFWAEENDEGTRDGKNPEFINFATTDGSGWSPIERIVVPDSLRMWTNWWPTHTSDGFVYERQPAILVTVWNKRAYLLTRRGQTWDWYPLAFSPDSYVRLVFDDDAVLVTYVKVLDESGNSLFSARLRPRLTESDSSRRISPVGVGHVHYPWPLRSRDGKLRVIWQSRHNNELGTFVHISESSDGGTTWLLGPRFFAPGGTDGMVVVEDSIGRVYVAARTAGDSSEAVLHGVLVGRQWIVPRPMEIAGSRAIGLPALVTERNGSVSLYFGAVLSEYIGKRPPVFLRSSIRVDC